jgi:hypothetical protein
VNETDANKIEQPPAPPTLSGYYADPKLKPSSFLKAVRSADIKVFQSQDLASAEAALTERDPDLSRTLALGLGNRVPDVVERWVIEAARSAVRGLDPAFTLEEGTSGETIFERVVRAQADALQSKSKTSRARAQNLVRLSLIWLIRRHSLDPLRVLYALAATSSKRANRESVRSQVQKMLVQAKPGQWKTLSAVARLSSDLVQRADRTASEAIQARDQMQGRVADLERSLESKQGEMEALSRERDRLRSELTANKSALEAERQLRELDLAQAAGRTRNLLAGRLSLLLSDARDALDFEPPHIEAARQRLDAAKETIVQEVSDSHD